jgi:uncharacterized protein YndB with AHSA1/START domain
MTTTDTTASPETTAAGQTRVPHAAAGSTQVYVLYINAPAATVWDAITEPAQVARFFHGLRLEADYRVGGRMRSLSPDGTAEWGNNEVLAYDPPRRLAHTWRSLYDPVMAPSPKAESPGRSSPPPTG